MPSPVESAPPAQNADSSHIPTPYLNPSGTRFPLSIGACFPVTMLAVLLVAALIGL